MSDDIYEGHDGDDGDSPDLRQDEAMMNEYDSFDNEGSIDGEFEDGFGFGYETERSTSMEDSLKTQMDQLEFAITSLKKSKTPEELKARSAQVKTLKASVKRAEAREVMNDNSEMATSLDVGMPSQRTVQANRLAGYTLAQQSVVKDLANKNLDGSRVASLDQVAVDAAFLDLAHLGNVQAELMIDQRPGPVTTFTPEMNEYYSPDLPKQDRLHNAPPSEDETSYLAERRLHGEVMIHNLPKTAVGPNSVDVSMALGFISEMENYNISGVARGSMATDFRLEDEKQEARIMQAKLNRVTGIYIPENTKNGLPQVQKARFESTQQAVVERLFTGPSVDAKSLIGMPNEMFLGVAGDDGDRHQITGLVPTFGGFRGANNTTPFTRLGYAEAIAPGGELNHLVGTSDEWKLAQYQPSVANTFFPIDADIDLKDWQDSPEGSPARVAKAKQKEQVDELYGDFKALKKYYTRVMPGLQDEIDGQGRSGRHTPIASLGANANNEAAFYDLDRDRVQIEHRERQSAQVAAAQIDEHGERYVPTATYGSQIDAVSGSDRSTMHGDTTGTTSGTSTFVNMLLEGASPELAYEQALNPASADYDLIAAEQADLAAPRFGPYRTDLEHYDEQLRHAPEQRTPEWFALREGRDTASMATKLLRNPLVRGLHAAEERLDPKGLKGWRSKGNDPFYGNAATQAGNVGEGKVQRAFMSEIQQYGEKHGGAFKGAQFREGIFEVNDKYAGMGASPDGRLFDAEGNSLGVVEFKFLGTKSASKALKTYTDQMQMQMMIANEQYATLAVLDTETGEYSQHTIEADLDHQERLFKASQISQSISSQVTDVVGIRDMRAVIAQQKTGNRSSQTTAANKVSGNEARFEFVGPQPEGAMPVFQEDDTDIDLGSVASAAGQARQLKYDKKNKEEQESEILKSHKQAIKHQRKLDLDAKNAPLLAAQAAKNKEQQGVEEEAMGANNQVDEEEREAKREALSIQKELNSAHGQALQIEREREVEARNNSGAFGKFKKSIKDSAFIIGIFTDAMKDLVDAQASGIDKAQDYKSMGIRAGTTTDAAANLTREWEIGGMTQQESRKALQQVGDVVQQIQQPESRAAYYEKVNRALSLNSETQRAKKIFSNDYFATKPSVQELAHKVASASMGWTPENRAYIFNALQLSEAAIYDPEGNLSNIDNLVLEHYKVPVKSAGHGASAQVDHKEEEIQMGLTPNETSEASIEASILMSYNAAAMQKKEKLRSGGMITDLAGSLVTLATNSFGMTKGSAFGAKLSSDLADAALDPGTLLKNAGRFVMTGTGTMPNESMGNIPAVVDPVKVGEDPLTNNTTVVVNVQQGLDVEEKVIEGGEVPSNYSTNQGL